MKKKHKLYPDLRRARNKEWYVALIGANGEEVWKTSETYKRKAGARKAFFLLTDVDFGVAF